MLSLTYFYVPLLLMDLCNSVWISNKQASLISTSGAEIIKCWHVYRLSYKSTFKLWMIDSYVNDSLERDNNCLSCIWWAHMSFSANPNIPVSRDFVKSRIALVSPSETDCLQTERHFAFGDWHFKSPQTIFLNWTVYRWSKGFGHWNIISCWANLYPPVD